MCARWIGERTLWICEETQLPNPPASGGNVGDGDSDRFDHIFYRGADRSGDADAGGLAGLARGFLRYTNRLAPNPMGPGVTLGVTEAGAGR